VGMGFYREESLEELKDRSDEIAIGKKKKKCKWDEGN